jgi:predicted HAD superfamily Cof-like phosphohydrolase
MREQLQMMEEFHRAFGHPTNYIDGFTRDNIALRVKLNKEECAELNDELWQSLQDNIFTPNLLKEGADLLYVLLGTFVSLGLGEQLIEAFKRVHESNMSKLGEDGKPIYREDGKVMKGPNYKAPTLDDLIGSLSTETAT